MHLFVSYAHVNLCHFFSSSWCQGLAATSACGSSWTFLFIFLFSNKKQYFLYKTILNDLLKGVLGNLLPLKNSIRKLIIWYHNDPTYSDRQVWANNEGPNETVPGAV